MSRRASSRSGRHRRHGRPNEVRVQTILDSIDNGAIALPEFWRGYVWDRSQVRCLMDSPYREHPVGSLLTWQTRTETAVAFRSS